MTIRRGHDDDGSCRACTIGRWSMTATAMSLLVAIGLGAATDAQAVPRQRFSKVMVIMLENQAYARIIGNPAASYINSELEARRASATQFYSNRRNSPTSYLAVSSGRIYSGGDGGRWAGSCTPSITCSTTDSSIYEQLTQSGRRWKIYSEDQDTNCQPTSARKYWVGHNPGLYYQHLGPNSYVSTGDGSCLRNVVPATQLKQDIAGATLPNYSFVVPSNCHNMHEGCYPLFSGVKQGDDWLRANLAGDATVAGGLIRWAETHDTLVIVTFDEGSGSDYSYCCPVTPGGGGGRIPTWVIGPAGKVKAGGYKSSVGYNLFSIFKTSQENWDLPPLYHASDPTVTDFSDFFVAGSTPPPLPPPPPGPPPPPPPPPGGRFTDGFESGNFSMWTTRTVGADGSAIVQQSLLHAGLFAARLRSTATSGSFAYARKAFTPTAELTTSGWFNVQGQGPSGSNVPLLRVFDASGARIVTLYRQNLSADQLWVNYGNSYAAAGRLALATWGLVSVRIGIAGATSTVEVTVNNVPVFQTTTANLGTAGAASVQVGNNTAAQPFDVVVDDIAAGPPV